LHDTSLIACDLNNMAFILRCMKKYHDAIINYTKAITLCYKMNYIYEKALAYNGLGATYTDLKQYKKAISYLKQSIHFFTISGNENYLPSAYHNIGLAYQGDNKSDTALFYLFKSLYLANQMNIRDQLVNTLKSISSTYYLLKEYDKAYEYQQLCNSINDSVFNLKKHMQLAEFQGKFELDKKNNQITQLATEQQKDKALIKLQWLLVIVSVLILLAMGFLAYWLFKKYMQHKQLAEFLSQQKETIELNLKTLENKMSMQTIPYAGSNLSEDELLAIVNHLESFLSETRLYLNNDLTYHFWQKRQEYQFITCRRLSIQKSD